MLNNFPDHQILRDGGPVVHCLKMLILSPAHTFVSFHLFCQQEHKCTGQDHMLTANSFTSKNWPGKILQNL